MSYASLIARVGNEPNKEIVSERVPIKAYGEATSGNIILHLHPAVSIGPTTHNAYDVRVAIFDEKTGGEPTSHFFCAPHVVVGQFVQLGTP